MSMHSFKRTRAGLPTSERARQTLLQKYAQGVRSVAHQTRYSTDRDLKPRRMHPWFDLSCNGTRLLNTVCDQRGPSDPPTPRPDHGHTDVICPFLSLARRAQRMLSIEPRRNLPFQNPNNNRTGRREGKKKERRKNGREGEGEKEREGNQH